MKQSIKIGFVGFGTVATGAVRILQDQQDLLERRVGTRLEIVKIADRDIERDRGIILPEGILTHDVSEVLEHPEIDIVVELIGGTTHAKDFLLEAIAQKKHVVTANKALVAEQGEILFEAAASQGVDVGFEAAVCGGIPIIREMKEGLAAEKLKSIYGIVNGTCNYILTKMRDEGGDFSEVLKEAQDLGFAEADPELDIGGGDSAHKLAILSSLAFGTPVNLKEIYTEGIERVSPIDIAFAGELGYDIKLLAITKIVEGEIEARVHPTMISKETLLSKVNGVFNAVYVEGETVGGLLFYGQGAGSLPTGSAVVSDLVEIARNILSNAHRRVPSASFVPEARKALRIRPMAEIESLYYLRFMVEDHPGVLANISGILGKNGISISSMIQEGRKIEGGVPLVMMTHKAKERDLQAALAEIGELDCIMGSTLLIRVEGEDPS